MLRLALPALAEQALVMLVGFSDTLLTGRYLDETHLAAVGLIAYVLWFFHTLFQTVGIGAMAMVARYVGAGDPEMARRVTNQAVTIGVAFAAVVVALIAIWCDQLVALMQLEPESARLAARFVRGQLLALPFIMLQGVGIYCLRGAGDMMAGLRVMGTVNLVNVAISWPLMLGVGPLPELGWDALIIGTCCGEVVGGLLVLWFLLRGRAGLQLRFASLRPDRELIARMLHIGVPGGADMVLMVIFHMTFLAMINRLGDLAAAAHGVAVRLESLSYLPGTAFQMAAATLAGQFLGAGEPRRAAHSVFTACLAGGGIMVSAGICFFLFADPLTQLFLNDNQTEVHDLAARLLRIVAFSQPALALAMILTGALRGAGDTRWPLAFTLIGLAGIRLPLAWVLTTWLDFGVAGAWYAMVIDLYLRCFLVVGRFLQGGWKRVRV
jgi:putative MATE family efflux protein